MIQKIDGQCTCRNRLYRMRSILCTCSNYNVSFRINLFLPRSQLLQWHGPDMIQTNLKQEHRMKQIHFKLDVYVIVDLYVSVGSY